MKWLMLGLMMAGCQVQYPVSPVDDGGSVEASVDRDCQIMCDHMEQLHCKMSTPRKGTPCVQWCSDVADFAREQIRCVALSDTCESASMCRVEEEN